MANDQHKDTTLTAEAKYRFSFTSLRKRFVSPLHYNGCNSFFFLMLQKYINSKQKNSEIKNYALWIGNIWEDFVLIIWKKALKGVFIFFLLILILLILTIF